MVGMASQKENSAAERRSAPSNMAATIVAPAREVPGSWWSDWSAWLRFHAGTQVQARTRLGSTAFPEIEPAPGRYVTVRIA